MRTAGAIWGVVGIVALLAMAIGRLAPYAFEALRSDLSSWQWVIVAAWCAFMVFTEGYDGFYRRLAPRIIARARQLRRQGDWVSIILAPLYCFGYFRAPKKQMVVSYVAIILIVCAVIIVQQISQPWRGIIDAGVVVGLLCGVGALFIVAARGVRRSA